MLQRFAIIILTYSSQCKLGSTVGYAIRFEDCTSPETKIKCRSAQCLPQGAR